MSEHTAERRKAVRKTTKSQSGADEYYASKLANVLFSSELSRWAASA